MEKLSKILLITLLICLIIIGSYIGYLGYVGYKIEQLDSKCKINLCKVGERNVTGYHYSPFTGICHCFNGKEVENYFELPLKI
jgi:hypothetical protein